MTRPKKPSAEGRPLRDTVFQSWVPALLAGLIAFFSSYLVNQKNHESTKDKLFTELKIRHADSTVVALAEYVSLWRRLIIRCKSYEDNLVKEKAETIATKKAQLSKANAERLAGIRELTKQRPVARDQLFGRLSVVKLYFSTEATDAISEFRRWDEDQQTKSCAEMPDPAAFKNYETKIIFLLRREVKP